MTELTNAEITKVIDDMRGWADGVNNKIGKIQAALAPQLDEADAIVANMVDLDAAQTSRAGDMGLLLVELAKMRSSIAEQKKSVAEMTTEAMMFAEGGNADKRKASSAAALKSNQKYQDTKEALAINEREKLVKQAHFDTAEREYKRLGSQLRNLRARLEHWTARARMSTGE